MADQMTREQWVAADHEPGGGWRVVTAAGATVTVGAACVCGHPDCQFTATVTHRNLVHHLPGQDAYLPA
jgi:hypothetical protein